MVDQERRAKLRALRSRVVVTGVGVLTGPCAGAEQLWQRLIDEGEHPTHRAVEGFDPRTYLERRLSRHTDTFAQLGAAAAVLARADAELGETDPASTGVVFGTGNGAGSSLIREHQHFAAEGPLAVDPLLGLRTMTNAAVSVVALTQQARGVTQAISSGCASGTHAVGEALRLIQHGECDVVYAGGSEAFYPGGSNVGYSEAILAALANMRVTTDEDTARPFDVDRRGFVPADGAACLVLESIEHATARGARIYCEVVGYGNTNDAFDLVAPEPEGLGIESCMRAALDDAGIEPDAVGFINAHGTGTPSNDLSEARAIRRLGGAPAVNSIKGVVGHAGPAAGAVEAASVVLAVERGVLPHTGGLRTVDDELGIDVVAGRPRTWEPGPAMSLSLGLGGHDGAVVFQPYAP